MYYPLTKEIKKKKGKIIMAHFCKVPEGTKISVLKEDTITPSGSVYLVMKEDSSYGRLERYLTCMFKDEEEARNYAMNHGGKLFWSTAENWKVYNWRRVLKTLVRCCDFEEVGDASSIPVGGYGMTIDYDIVVHCNEGFIYWSDDNKLVFNKRAPDVTVAYNSYVNRDNTDRELKLENVWVTIRHGVYTLVNPIGRFTGVNASAINNSRFKATIDVMMIPQYLEGDSFKPWANKYPFNMYNLSYRMVAGPITFDIKDDKTYVTCDMSSKNRYGIKEKLSVPLIPVTFASAMSYACSIFNSYHRFCYVVGSTLNVFNPLSELWEYPNMLQDGENGNTTVTRVLENNVFKYFIQMNDELVPRCRVLLRRGIGDRDFYTVLGWCNGKNFFDEDTSCDHAFIVDGVEKRCTWDEYRRVYILYEDSVKSFCYRNDLPYDGWGNGGYIYDKTVVTCPHCGKKYIDDAYHTTNNTISRYVDGELTPIHEICPDCMHRFGDCNEDIVLSSGEAFSHDEYEQFGKDIIPKEDLVWNDEMELLLMGEICAWDAVKEEWVIPNEYTVIDGPRGIKRFHEKYCCHVNEYSYKPEPIFCKDGNEDTEKFFGVELELMHGGESDRNVAKICKDIPYLYAKHDGSLDDGIELVSHPCTLAYHKSGFGWCKVMERAVELGYDTPSGSGIHVHLSKAFWDKQDKVNMIAFIIAFCDMHREAIRYFADRDSYEFDRWTRSYLSERTTEEAVEGMFSNYSSVKEISAKLYRSYQRASTHYSGVNLSNYNTVEFRFFHSSTNPKRLLSILQFVDCLSELSITVTKDTMITFGRITEYAKSKGYNELLEDELFIGACEYDRLHPVYLDLNKHDA